jgi:hypothetical protein
LDVNYAAKLLLVATAVRSPGADISMGTSDHIKVPTVTWRTDEHPGLII